MLEKRNAKKIYLLTFVLLIEKYGTLWLWHHVIRKTCTTLYQNRPRFVKDMTKIFLCFSVHNSNCCLLAKRECYVSQGRVETLFRWCGKHLHFCTDKFTQDNMYQFLSQSVTFCRLCFGVFLFGSHVNIIVHFRSSAPASKPTRTCIMQWFSESPHSVRI